MSRHAATPITAICEARREARGGHDAQSYAHVVAERERAESSEKEAPPTHSEFKPRAGMLREPLIDRLLYASLVGFFFEAVPRASACQA